MKITLKDRGYGEFSGMLSPSKTKFIINIPKNASSYVQTWTTQYGWMTSTLLGDNWHSVNQISVILRDPVERWISGIAQYITTYVLSPVGPNGPILLNSRWANIEENKALSAEQFINLYSLSTERLLFDNIYRFDDHVWPQYAFIHDLRPYVERKYFFLDQNFDRSFAPHHGLLPSENLDHNKGSANPNTKILQDFFKKLLDSRPDLLSRVKEAYKEDYNLIKEAFNK